MPEVHFIGSIDSVAGADSGDELCVTWALVPGNDEWYIHKGSFFGETQVSSVGLNGRAVLNHPLDVQFNTESSEGWPRLVCELWQRESVFPLFGDGSSVSGGAKDSSRGFIGCGTVWLPPPSCHGMQSLRVNLWRPTRAQSSTFSSLGTITDKLLPSMPDMERLRHITINPDERAMTHTDPAGEVIVAIQTLVTKDFRSFGVHL